MCSGSLARTLDPRALNRCGSLRPMAIHFAPNDVIKMESEFSTETQAVLRPITSNDTGRYERTGLSEPCSMTISSAMFTHRGMPEPEYLPQGWTAHVHPEGQLYFSRTGSPRVVTEAYMYRKDVLENVLCWTKRIEDIALQRNFPLSPQIELFLKLEEEDCAYYFVDHSTLAQTWMEQNLDTEELGLPAVVSVPQLKLLCEELYWTHVEHFPMHFGALPVALIDSLICVFTHGICDQMTSRVSTFPYSKQECEGFVSLLKSSREHPANGNIVCTVARLWSLICRNRYLTFYGQEFSRLSRDQAVLYDPTTKHEWVSSVASRVSFKTTDKYLAQLNDVFVDHLVYAEQWKNLVSGCLTDWRSVSREAFFTLMLHMFFLVTPSCLSLAIASTALLGASILASVVLLHRFEPMQDLCAAEAMNYLDTIESQTFKFQFVALAFSLPRTFYLWGLLAVVANCISMFACFFGRGLAAAVLVGVAVVFLLLQWTTSETFNLRLAHIRARWSRNVECTSMV
ncbi:hypothetical protein MIND_00160100 [Mycena indigotica]|uniref:WW domain-containing protein n=1 Tax=Mycena indigotica TaxID=2126181 RepID=A0A8H6WIR9_9AGAR|nr:uncharacterized protein MIND_00160100 [Mycena indigotica]KAF7316413.1 hypothetical protein MIND_00160100 [Mycena indigotica]